MDFRIVGIYFRGTLTKFHGHEIAGSDSVVTGAALRGLRARISGHGYGFPKLRVWISSKLRVRISVATETN